MAKLGVETDSKEILNLAEEDGHKVIVQKVEKSMWKSPNFYLSWLAPLPLYTIFYLLFAYDQCTSSLNSLPHMVLLGTVVTFEFLHIMLFCLPGKYDGPLVDLEQSSEEIEKDEECEDNDDEPKNVWQWIHFLCSIVTIWTVLAVFVECSRQALYKESFYIFFHPVSFLALFASFRLLLSFKSGDWVKKEEVRTIGFSIL